MTTVQQDLFSDVAVLPPTTEGIKYAGSKLRLLPYILELAGSTQAKVVIDAFAGTTRVSQAFAQTGYRVICNDIAVWTRTLAQCYLGHCQARSDFEELVNHLNATQPIDGWITENYGGIDNNGSAVQLDGTKRPWQVHNTRRADAIRCEIDRLSLTETEKAVALTSLILALDRVDSTMGHFVSYLRDWSPRSYNDLVLRVPAIFEHNGGHKIFCEDVFDFLEHANADLAYLDPPYGSNNEKMPPSRVRYASYYHVWKSIVLNDCPQVFGKVRRRVDSSDRVAGSVFEEFRRAPSGRYIAVEAIEKALDAVDARWVILSYNSGGRATASELDDLIRSKHRMLRMIEVKHKKNVMAGMSWTGDWLRDAEFPNREFLFLIEKK